MASTRQDEQQVQGPLRPTNSAEQAPDKTAAPGDPQPKTRLTRQRIDTGHAACTGTPMTAYAHART